MILKLIECVNAFMAIRTLENERLPFKSAHTLMKLKGELKEHAEFYEAEERKLIAEYGEKADDRGNYRFEGENAKRFTEARKELSEMEVELGGEKKRIAPPDSITPAAYEALSCVCEFEVNDE